MQLRLFCLIWIDYFCITLQMAALNKSTDTEIEFNTNVQTMEQQHDAS